MQLLFQLIYQVSSKITIEYLYSVINTRSCIILLESVPGITSTLPTPYYTHGNNLLIRVETVFTAAVRYDFHVMQAFFLL